MKVKYELTSHKDQIERDKALAITQNIEEIMSDINRLFMENVNLKDQ